MCVPVRMNVLFDIVRLAEMNLWMIWQSFCRECCEGIVVYTSVVHLFY